MSITVRPTYAGRSGGHSLPNERKYTRLGTVTTTSIETEPAIILALGVPRVGDPFGPSDLGALCTNVAVEMDRDSELVWNVRAEYSTFHGDEQQQNEEPLLRPTIWRYTSVRGTRTQAKDAQDQAYENTHGDPLGSPPEMVYSTARYTITRNEPSFDSDDADDYANTVNDTPWYGKAAGKVLCEGIQAEEQWEGNHHFYVVVYTIHVDKKKWQPVEVANQGYKYGTPEEESTTLVWLNAAGGKWVGGTDPEADKYVEFNPWETKNLNDLSL